MTRPAPYLPHHRTLLAGLGPEADGAERCRVDRAFLDFLLTEFARQMPFHAAFYAATYPDIAAAAARGEVDDLREHFVRIGYAEGRMPCALAFDPDYYLARNPDLFGLGQDAGARWAARAFRA